MGRFTIFATAAGTSRLHNLNKHIFAAMVQPTSLTRIIPISVTSISIAAALAAVIGIASCSDRKPGPAVVPHMDTGAAPASHSDTSPPQAGAQAGSQIDTTSAAPQTGMQSGAQTSGGDEHHAAAQTGPAWNRAELVTGVQSFVTAIDSNNQKAFWGSLSARSLRMIDHDRLASRDQIWKDARETLSDIQNRRITVIGGSRDSVALRIDGKRLIEGERENDPIIIQLLREQRQWKVVYPGLLYPEHDLRKSQ